MGCGGKRGNSQKHQWPALFCHCKFNLVVEWGFLQAKQVCAPDFLALCTCKPFLFLQSISVIFQSFILSKLFLSTSTLKNITKQNNTKHGKGTATAAAEVISLMPCLPFLPPPPHTYKHSYLRVPDLTKAGLRTPAIKLLEEYMVCYLLYKKEIRKVYTLFLQKESQENYIRNYEKLLPLGDRCDWDGKSKDESPTFANIPLCHFDFEMRSNRMKKSKT